MSALGCNSIQNIPVAARTAQITILGTEYNFTIDMAAKASGAKKSLFTCPELENEWEIPLLYGFYHYNGRLTQCHYQVHIAPCMTRYQPLARGKSDMPCPLNEKDAILLAIWRTMCNTPKEWVVVLVDGEKQCKFLDNTVQSSFFFRTRYCDPTADFDVEAAKLMFLSFRHGTRRHFDKTRTIPRDCKNPLAVITAQAKRERREEPESVNDDGDIAIASLLEPAAQTQQRTSLRLLRRRSCEDAAEHALSSGSNERKATKVSSIKVTRLHPPFYHFGSLKSDLVQCCSTIEADKTSAGQKEAGTRASVQSL